MSFAVNKVMVIILHQRRIMSDCLPGSFDKQDPEEIIAAKGNTAGVSCFAAFSYPWNKSDITCQVIDIIKPVNIPKFCYQSGAVRGPIPEILFKRIYNSLSC